MVISEIRNLTNGAIDQSNEDNIKYIWFGAETYALPLWKNGKPTSEFFSRIYFIICAVLTCLHSLLFIIVVWISRIKTYKENNKVIPEFVSVFSIFTVVPLFILHADTARWFADFILYEIIILSVLTIFDGTYTENFFKNNKFINNAVIKYAFLLFVLITTFWLKSSKWEIFFNGFIEWLSKY